MIEVNNRNPLMAKDDLMIQNLLMSNILPARASYFK